jgi:putative heme-binding domain-containing protein
MNKLTFCTGLFCLIVAAGAIVPGQWYSQSSTDEQSAKKTAGTKQKAPGLPARTPWTTSKITGTPEPPHPYKIVRSFPKLHFRNPLLMMRAPEMNRFFVAEHQGKMYSFPMDEACEKADLFLDPNADIQSWDPKGKVKNIDTVYGLAFHPEFQKNRYCYICYVLNSKKDGEQLPDGSRVSRFTVVGDNPPRVDTKSEKILITFMAGGHNGGDLHFGKDGYLYISTGDAANPNPPDALDTGQDCSDLLSSILRIDVDHEDPDKAYKVPLDNPFVNLKNVRPEIWSFGFRNPWRMSFDRLTGDLWVGDVGWELWEMVYRIQKGGNYGWSVMEGPQPVRPESRRGPTPILPPNYAFPHTEGASITGGYVYRGKKLKELYGAYICGDWVTRKLWATKYERDKEAKPIPHEDTGLTFDPPDKIVWHKELAQGAQRIVAFGEDHDGELYFLNYDENGTIHQIVPNEAIKDYKPTFPKKLSETGLFSSIRDHVVAPGVVPFSINAEQWADHATAERFVALPGTSTIKMHDTPVSIPGGFFSGQVFFPKDGVLARTVSIEMEAANPQSRKRMETQILHYDGEFWRGYTYQWNDEQTDAVLVPAAGNDRALVMKDAKAPGGVRKQNWHFHSRTECLTCHNPWAGHTLAFTQEQLNRDHDYGGFVENQLRAFQRLGIVRYSHKDDWEGTNEVMLSEPPPIRLVNPHDAAGDINDRARSYLHANCAHCHRFGAGGTADLQLRFDVPLNEMKTVEVRPVQGAFDIHSAHIISPGDPYRSVLYYRMAKLGRGRMPHMGSEMVDERGLRLILDWIRQLPRTKAERTLLEKLRSLDEGGAVAREKIEAEIQIHRDALAVAKTKNRATTNAEDRKEAETAYKNRAKAAAKQRAAEREETVKGLLGSTGSALLLARAVEEKRVPPAIRTQIVAAATASADVQVRDLFERFLPDDQRVKRLGSVIKPEQILKLKGDAERGKTLFFKSATMQCINCHKVNGTGSTLGPDLSQIAKKYTRAQILESILEPSKFIDPKYVAYVVETADGRNHTGLLGEKTDKEIVLKMQGDKEVRIPIKDVEHMAPQKNSLMPELLLRDLTAEQAADLLEFLVTLK